MGPSIEQNQQDQQQQENARSNNDWKAKRDCTYDSDATKTVETSSLLDEEICVCTLCYADVGGTCICTLCRANVHVTIGHQEVQRIRFEESSQLTRKQCSRHDKQRIGTEKSLTQESMSHQEVLRIKTENAWQLVEEKKQNLEMKKPPTNERKHELNLLLKPQQTLAEKAQVNAPKKFSQAKAISEKAESEEKTDQAVQSLVDSFLQEDPLWNQKYQELIRFKTMFGHCNVKRVSLNEKSSGSEYAQLGHWVAKLRRQARLPSEDSRRLEPYQVVALNNIGFEWRPRGNAWADNYIKLKAYMDTHGRGAVPSKRGGLLGAWCSKQVQYYNRYQANLASNINEEKIALLNKIGFIWNRKSNAWNQRYEALAAYYKKNGHCRIPTNYKDRVLVRWVSKERIKYRNFLENKTPAQTKEQHQLLQRVNFIGGLKGTRKRGKKKATLKENGKDIPASTVQSQHEVSRGPAELDILANNAQNKKSASREPTKLSTIYDASLTQVAMPYQQSSEERVVKKVEGEHKTTECKTSTSARPHDLSPISISNSPTECKASTLARDIAPRQEDTVMGLGTESMPLDISWPSDDSINTEFGLIDVHSTDHSPVDTIL